MNITPLNQLKLSDVAHSMGAQLESRWSNYVFSTISTDTRTIQRGEYYLALKGENFDGHQYLGMAVEKGAAGVISHRDVSADIAEKVPVLRVQDTLRAYGDFAAERRRTWGGKVFAISGSVGKTTTRRILAKSLSRKYRVLEPIKNFNNLIGLPHTLLELNSTHQMAVLELGMNMPGELARLTEIAAPDIAGLTRIGRTHVGMFRSLDELIEAKLSLFAGTKPGAPLIVNAGCRNSTRAIPRFSSDHPIVTFRISEEGSADVRIHNIRPLKMEIGYSYSLSANGTTWDNLKMRHFGRHHLEDAACASAMLLAGGYDPSEIIEVAERLETEAYRGQVERVGDWTFIIDCYNASPDSMKGSLESLKDFKSGDRDGSRLILVLADMLELGAHSHEAHEELLPLITDLLPAILYGLGPECIALTQKVKAVGVASIGFTSRDDLLVEMQKSLAPGDIVFFKGSHGFALEKVAEALMKQGGS